jgi:hypothetical protein
LLPQDAVKPDDSPAGTPERAVEQGAPDAAPPNGRAHDVEPDERIPVAVQRAGDGGKDLARALCRQERVGIRREKSLFVVESRLPPLRVRPGDRGLGRTSARR